jgi:3-methylcrotonyl-CoA carboxylase alpha subunit
MSAVRLRAAAAGDERDVSVLPGGTVIVGDDHYSMELIDPVTWRVTQEGRTWIVHVARDDEGCWVHVDGVVYRIDLAPAGARPRQRSHGADHGLSAPMPATVLSVVAEAGQEVRSGDAVLMLEAMKMELAVRAPRDGVVTAVHCREGDLVQPGITLVEIE